MDWRLFVQVCILMILGGGLTLVVSAIVLEFKNKK